jgi:hypothetical protein
MFDKPTTLTASLVRGQETQTLLALQKQGVTSDDYAAIGTNAALCADVYAAILKHRLFTSPEDQITRLLEINEHVWKDPSVTEEAIRAIGSPPELPVSDEHHLRCITLLYETGDVAQTFERNWLACQYKNEDKVLRVDYFQIRQTRIRYRPGVRARKVGFRWAVCELGREFKGRSVNRAFERMFTDQTMGIGQELPLIAALHPKWVLHMDGNKIPFVVAPDIQVTNGAGGKFELALYILFSRRDGTVRLGTEFTCQRDSKFGPGSLR